MEFDRKKFIETGIVGVTPQYRDRLRRLEQKNRYRNGFIIFSLFVAVVTSFFVPGAILPNLLLWGIPTAAIFIGFAVYRFASIFQEKLRHIKRKA